MLQVAGPADELGVPIRCCVATPLDASSAVLRTNITPFALWGVLTFGDAYSFLMSSVILYRAWAVRLLSSAPASLRALQLVSR
jgi:hypothetical protein